MSYAALPRLVELTSANTLDERIPFTGSEHQDGPVRIPGVAHRRVGDSVDVLDERDLNVLPVRIGTWFRGALPLCLRQVEIPSNVCLVVIDRRTVTTHDARYTGRPPGTVHTDLVY